MIPHHFPDGFGVPNSFTPKKKGFVQKLGTVYPKTAFLNWPNDDHPLKLMP